MPTNRSEREERRRAELERSACYMYGRAAGATAARPTRPGRSVRGGESSRERRHHGMVRAGRSGAVCRAGMFHSVCADPAERQRDCRVSSVVCVGRCRGVCPPPSVPRDLTDLSGSGFCLESLTRNAQKTNILVSRGLELHTSAHLPTAIRSPLLRISSISVRVHGANEIRESTKQRKVHTNLVTALHVHALALLPS